MRNRPHADMSDSSKPLQEIHSPNSICFGCGPANPHGLHLRSFVDDDCLTAIWTPKPHLVAWPGMVNGGILGTLLDCHCNWTAAYFLMLRDELTELPSTVTAEYTVRFLHPTPSDAPIRVIGEVVRLGRRSAVTKGTVYAADRPTAECEATFVSVEETHPAYGRWRG